MINFKVKGAFTALIVSLLLTGCLERKEHITVYEDGTIDWRASFQGENANDFDNHDAIPTIASGWTVEDEVVPADNGKQSHTRLAARRFPGGVDLPSSFAHRGDPMEEAYLQFPTTLRIETRDDGTYYHFARVYQPRDYAQTGLLVELAEKEFQKFGDRLNEGEPLGRSEWRNIAEQMVKVSIEKYEIWARKAFVETQTYAPQDAWLGVVTALDDFRRAVDYDTIATLAQQHIESEDPDNNIFTQLEHEFDRAATDTINRALSEHPNVQSTSAFRARFAFHKKAWEITEDLNDEKFTIRVEMPGQIVAHNADSRANNIVTWTFGGEFLHDRSIELLVTSRIAN